MPEKSIPIYEDAGEEMSHHEPTIPVGEAELDIAVQALGRGDMKLLGDFIASLRHRMDLALGYVRLGVIGVVTISTPGKENGGQSIEVQ